MNEMMSTTEQKLWYDGPNYTADSIVIHPESRQVLLVNGKPANGRYLAVLSIQEKNHSRQPIVR